MPTPPQPPAVAQPLYNKILSQIEGSPYTLTPTDKGFDFKVDIVDAKWWGLLDRSGLKQTFIHHVEVIDSTTYRVAEEFVKISWTAGVPYAQYTQERMYGSVTKLSFGKAYALNDKFRPDEDYSYKFTSEESANLLRAAADSLGMRRKTHWSVIVGAVAAIIAVVGTILVFAIPLTMRALG